MFILAAPNASVGDPAQSGMWSGTVSLPNVSVHAALLPSGKILMSDGQSLGDAAIVWDPATNSIDSVPAPVNIFCNGLEQMADGKILVVGGHVGAHAGLSAANVFDPSTQSWTSLPDMAFPRWYPSATMLSDGRIIVTSGETNCDECDETIQEIYNPSANSWSQLTAAPFFFPYYPHVFLLPDGRIVVPGDGEAPIVSEVLDLKALAWTAVGGPAVDGGSTVMYLPGKFLKMGTSVDPDTAVRNSVATAYVLDMTQSTPTWRQVQSMAFPRTYQFATSLPDGNVLVTGGGTTTDAIGISTAVLPAELWSPDTEMWTTLASMNAPRLYHSIALLLPDARVLVSGGGRFDGTNEPTDQPSAEFFSPPYLFKGPRPAITSAPSQVTYGYNFTVQTPQAATIAKVSLVRFGTATHALNMSQQFVPLAFSAGPGSLTVAAPVDGNLAPPGNYMLFLVDTSGVPSVAAVVQVGQFQPPVTNPPPTNPPPTNSPPPVLTGNGTSDILWRNTQTGDNAIWLMNGSSIVSVQFLPNVDVSWKIAGKGDFNGDGKADILWYNPAASLVAIWTMNGSTKVGGSILGGGSPDWDVVAVADFDHTGFADILWRQKSSGDLYLWKNLSPLNFDSIRVASVDTNWQVSGVADVEGTGLPDIVFRNTVTGGLAIWQLRNDQPAQQVFLGDYPLEYQIAGFGDFSGDGKQDILWRNKNSGAVYVWVMSGFSVASVWYGGAPGLDWKIVGTPALTGGKFSDVLWANTTTGSIGVWWGSSTGLVPGPTFSSVGAGWSPMPAQQ